MLLQSVTSLVFIVVSSVTATPAAAVAFTSSVFPVLNAYFYAVSTANSCHCCFYHFSFFTVTLLQKMKYTI